MNKEFIPYEEALALKELGFDEECLGFYMKEGLLRFLVIEKISIIKNSVFLDEKNCLAPLYQQAFRWFREKHTLSINIFIGSASKKWNTFIQNCDLCKDVADLEVFETYEEAELACLKKIIKIIKQNKYE